MKISLGDIDPPLTMIFIISSSDLPIDCKCATVLSISKGKGASDDCGNYRSISVTIHVSKIIDIVSIKVISLMSQFYNIYIISFH